jgi:protein-S-isoprenylcysteine O-methyltransferase Ste14
MISPGLREALNRVRVRSGSFLAIVVYGALAAAAGLLIRAWASGHLRKEKALAVSGPYRYSRNPLYLGNFVIGAGIVLTARSWWVLPVFAAYFGIFYPLIITRERDRMRRLFPEEYEEYGRQVPLFLPSFLRRHRAAAGRFSWRLYRLNREYRALAGTVGFWALLAVKALLLNR